MWSVDTLGDWLSLDIKLGHSDLVYGFYRVKFTYPYIHMSVSLYGVKLPNLSLDLI